ncbi:hypothetical protein Lesp02_46300 [Lentzea sp. NBRC 105346]|uniref:hypothetical protein n=1 Tax=Lentzea sp. NBRC 105346 TaxID=3032205 RepID=UPI0024A2AD49|nr:hypothetical protein [Lentzea sp. NBRC 105346]GLZ32442.1 hypothetical protein Lesp02_46300 [Lentzea sp. NBRC 105346]
MPDLAEPEDRVHEVRRRAVRLHRRRRMTMAGSAVVLIVIPVAVVPAWPRGEPVEPFTSGAGPSPTCPAYADEVPKMGQGAPGLLVPDGAVRGTLCVYRPDHDAFVAAHPEARDAGCFARSTGLKFGYPDGSERSVVFVMNCGTVESGDVVRYGEITEALDEFTERYRAAGGEAPPPWKW